MSTIESHYMDDSMSMSDIDSGDLNNLLHECKDTTPNKPIDDQKSYGVVLDPEEEEKHRGFDYDEENMMADLDDWG